MGPSVSRAVHCFPLEPCPSLPNPTRGPGIPETAVSAVCRGVRGERERSQSIPCQSSACEEAPARRHACITRGVMCSGGVWNNRICSVGVVQVCKEFAHLQLKIDVTREGVDSEGCYIYSAVSRRRLEAEAEVRLHTDTENE